MQTTPPPRCCIPQHPPASMLSGSLLGTELLRKKPLQLPVRLPAESHSALPPAPGLCQHHSLSIQEGRLRAAQAVLKITELVSSRTPGSVTLLLAQAARFWSHRHSTAATTHMAQASGKGRLLPVTSPEH